MDEALEYFKKNGVKCKKVDDGDHSFIAVFGYGKLTRKEIVKVIRERDLLCMFFEGAIREDERSKRLAADE